MKKAIIISLWVICIVAVIDESLNMISKASTIENIIGLLILVLMVVISIKTKCFTDFKIKKNEKGN